MKSIIYIVLVFQIFSVKAQDQSIAQDPKAEPFLENISEKFLSGNAFQVEFRYEIYSAMEDATVSDYGSILVKDKMYKLKTEDNQVFYNGKYLWVYNMLSEEVYQSIPSENSPDQLLSNPFLHLGNFRDHFKYRYKGIQKINGVNYSEIDLYTINTETGYSILRVLCSEGGNEIYSITMKQKNGTDIRVFVNEINTKLELSSDVFSWDPERYPDALLIEL